MVVARLTEVGGTPAKPEGCLATVLAFEVNGLASMLFAISFSNVLSN